ncbi:hypothetical protein F2P56_028094 [Juglans regia]|uniref:Thionin-like protein 2 n=2 Tax=Juglans regia TaxID=51240 RepID=A0A833U504_JUGRE|nr:thionin-like protein 2 [Juglans regia]KAF5453169.1 hypothetical protein F2P56_028094 [Juglans regia]
MEETRLRSVAIVVISLMLGMVVKDSTAYDKQKYESCFSLCCLDSYQPPFSCSFKCLKKGMKPAFVRFESGNESAKRIVNCRIRCAESKCSKISTQKHPNGDEVGNCMINCSKICKSQSPPQGPRS